MSQPKNDGQWNHLNCLLESMEDDYASDEKKDSEIVEGAIGNIAGNIGKVVGSGTKEIIEGLAKGVMEGILGPKDIRLMKAAAKAFQEVLENQGIKQTEETISKFLSKTLSKELLKQTKKIQGKASPNLN